MGGLGVAMGLGVGIGLRLTESAIRTVEKNANKCLCEAMFLAFGGVVVIGSVFVAMDKLVEYYDEREVDKIKKREDGKSEKKKKAKK